MNNKIMCCCPCAVKKGIMFYFLWLCIDKKHTGFSYQCGVLGICSIIVSTLLFTNKNNLVK